MLTPLDPRLRCKKSPCNVGGHCSFCGACNSRSGSTWKGASLWYCGDCEQEHRRRKCTWGDMLGAAGSKVIQNWWYPEGTVQAYPFVRTALTLPDARAGTHRPLQPVT